MGILGVEPDRLVIIGERALEVALAGQGAAPPAIGLGIGGVDLDRLVEVGDGLVQLVLVGQELAASGVENRKLAGISLDKAAAGGDALVRRGFEAMHACLSSSYPAATGTAVMLISKTQNK